MEFLPGSAGPGSGAPRPCGPQPARLPPDQQASLSWGVAGPGRDPGGRRDWPIQRTGRCAISAVYGNLFR